jgi:malonyl-CoA O-methyltransferase
MADAAAPRSTRRAVDAAALARVRRRLAAAGPPWLHLEAARRMGERLAVLKRPPTRAIDWYGDDRGALREACPRAERLRVDHGEAPPRARPWWRRWTGGERTLPVDGFPAGAGDLLWANMGLHWQPDPLVEMHRWFRALAVDGILMFTTLGPGSLGALRALYAGRGWGEPFAPFVDMHDLGDMLVEAGFTDPVMDQEVLHLSWTDAPALLAELRQWGGNAAPPRHAGLRTPRWQKALHAALAAPGERPALDVELVYGHAVRQPIKPRVAAETQIGLQDMRSILRGGSRT